MTISSLIAPNLPYLRRYARALTGSQQAGDAYVVTLLEALIADPSSFDRNADSRVALYHAFTRIWNSVAVNGERDISDGFTAEDRKLEAISSIPRQAFLLTAVEGFAVEDVGAILDRPAAQVQDLISVAGNEIAEQLRANVLIIEDEPLIAMDLEDLVTELGHNVQAIARTHTEALAAIESGKPHLVLADIQLADGSSGLNAVHDILGVIEVPVIFITAYPERLLTGERPEPVFLISKPFQPAQVKALISQALFFDQRARRRQAA